MADSNFFDRVLGSDPAGAELGRAIADRRLELVITHVQELEIARTPDVAKRERLLAVPRRIIGASAFVVGLSRIGIDKLGDGAVYNHVAKPREDYVKDLRTDSSPTPAAAEGLPLVTEERRRLRTRALEAGVTVWNVDELLDELRQRGGSEGS